jgi:hypothetical protein
MFGKLNGIRYKVNEHYQWIDAYKHKHRRGNINKDGLMAHMMCIVWCDGMMSRICIDLDECE